MVGLLGIIVLLAGLFLLRFAHLQLASDDLDWLAGRAPTVFDQYRLLPRLFFQALNAIWGPSPVAALVMSFAFHALNILLVYTLARRLRVGQAGSLAAAWVFAVNPLTLSTLTWFSCFSYILGTTLGLAACLCCLRSGEGKRATLWAVLTIAFYQLSLFSCHELLFLPLVFLALSWRTHWKLDYAALLLFLVTTLLGLATEHWYYRFTELAIDPSGLLSVRFILAGLSSLFSYVLALLLTYPLSFFGNPTALLQALLAEPLRWLLTAALACGLVLAVRRQTWRPILAALAATSALIVPYILRIYLMPANIHYSPEYLLSGRVFYIPFAALALAWGILIQWLAGAGRRRQVLAVVAIGFAFAWAVFVAYQPGDFLGLNVMKAGAGAVLSRPPDWNPFGQVTPAGLGWVTAALAAGLLLRRNHH